MITVTSVLIEDQEKALRFYTEILGFVKKLDDTCGNLILLVQTNAA